MSTASCPPDGSGEVSRPGDSGSWWLDSGSRKLVALHFAGYTAMEAALAMSMPRVLDALDMDIATAATGIAPAITERAPWVAAASLRA